MCGDCDILVERRTEPGDWVLIRKGAIGGLFLAGRRAFSPRAGLLGGVGGFDSRILIRTGLGELHEFGIWRRSRMKGEE